MGYSFDFDAVNSILRCSWEGQLTDEVLLNGDATGRRLAASRPLCRGIHDFSAVTTFEASSEVIKRIARMPPAYGVDQTVVLVAPTDLLYGLCRMFVILGEETRPNEHVVRTMEKAYGLLNVDSPQFSHLDSD